MIDLKAIKARCEAVKRRPQTVEDLLHEHVFRANALHDMEDLIAEVERLRKALGDMLFAYENKDGENPHQFEDDAVVAALKVLKETK